MIRAELAKKISHRIPHLFKKDVELAVKKLLNSLSDALVEGARVEIRGFGTFSLRTYEGRLATNPRTREKLRLGKRSIPYFRASRLLHKRLNEDG